MEPLPSKNVILLPKCPSEQCHAALLLAALEDGTILPPSLLFKVSSISSLCTKDNIYRVKPL
jgi:hypothetical protein